MTTATTDNQWSERTHKKQNLASTTQLNNKRVYLIESRLLSFATAEEDLRIETSCPLNEATAVFMLKNLCYHHTSHSDEPLYQIISCLKEPISLQSQSAVYHQRIPLRLAPAFPFPMCTHHSLP